MASRLSRAGWVSAAGPSAKARSTFAVTCWTKLDVVPEMPCGRSPKIASTQRTPRVARPPVATQSIRPARGCNAGLTRSGAGVSGRHVRDKPKPGPAGESGVRAGARERR